MANVFISEFDSKSWILIAFSGLSIIIIVMVILYILMKYGIEECQFASTYKRARFTLVSSLNISFRAYLNKPTNNRFKSQTYQCIRLILMVLGFILMSYYRGMLNAALNVDMNEIPIKTWEDVLQSHYKILVIIGTIHEDRFKYGDDVRKQIHKEKILTVEHEKQLQNIGYGKSVPAITSGDYLVFDNDLLFITLNEYPCQIVDIPSRNLR